jgi:putative ABC transport system permease protein
MPWARIEETHMFKQILALTSLNIRSMPQRWGMSLATIISIALVVGVLLAFLAMANGFAITMSGSGREDVAVVLRKGAQAELNSGVTGAQVRLIEEAPGVARDASGNPVTSGELYVITDGLKRTTMTEVNLPLRGVGKNAQKLRYGFEMSRGRMFSPGSNELIVGESVIREFAGFDLGQEVRLGTNTWKVVGAFTTGGTVFESEIWADASVLQNLYRRGNTVQTMRILLDGEDGLQKLQDWAENEPQVSLDIKSEKEFFAGQSGTMEAMVKFVGWPLAVIMAIGALAGAWNAMYASVDARTREIATLRTIGFGGFPAFVATMVEAILLALIGGIVGTLFVYLLFNGFSASTLGDGFTQVVFTFEVTPQSVQTGIFLAIFVGIFGGLAPAIRAARIPLLAAQS